jgi:hypothetical protein
MIPPTRNEGKAAGFRFTAPNAALRYKNCVGGPPVVCLRMCGCDYIWAIRIASPIWRRNCAAVCPRSRASGFRNPKRGVSFRRRIRCSAVGASFVVSFARLFPFMTFLCMFIGDFRSRRNYPVQRYRYVIISRNAFAFLLEQKVHTLKK